MLIAFNRLFVIWRDGQLNVLIQSSFNCLFVIWRDGKPDVLIRSSLRGLHRDFSFHSLFLRLVHSSRSLLWPLHAHSALLVDLLSPPSRPLAGCAARREGPGKGEEEEEGVKGQRVQEVDTGNI